LERSAVVKPEWGAKRACPKCNTRFYDLTKDDPVTCISCGFAWVPEPILKSKQPLPFEAAKPVAVEGGDVADEVLAEEDLDIGDDDGAADEDDVDIGGDDELANVTVGGDDDEV
jgi:uncharacterized protein (TIGR02300 family)